jgi:Membrane MotB of proton-channel complex MotA/MotB
MKASGFRAPRWALSFADLSLVLLAFFVLLQAERSDPASLAAGVRKAFGNNSHAIVLQRLFTAAPLFEEGEAVLKPEARAELLAIGRQALATGAGVRVASLGVDASSARFDGWELAAARLAAVARAIASTGIDQRRIDIAIPATAPATAGQGQHISVTLSR